MAVDWIDPLRELRALVQSAGGIPVVQMVQRRGKLDPAYYVGKGKAEEIRRRAEADDADVVIFDNDLSPAQIRDLEEIVERKVIDRSELILDIFASRAQTHEARLQVELAQLEYTAPRLRGMWTHLERIAGAGGATGAGAVGGIGTRGPGERQIEIDRRIVSRRVTALKRELAVIDRRKVQMIRSRRDQFTVSLVGYTNAGKSTLLNALTGADALVEDRLFATLDTKTRRWELSHGHAALLSDTVGFVRDLPHHLVASFRATLEEAIHADLLLHVIDAASPQAQKQVDAVMTVLEGLGCADHRILPLLNKVDAAEDESVIQMLERRLPNALRISARTGLGLDVLTTQVSELMRGEVRHARVHLPLADGKALAFLEHHAEVLDRRYESHRVELEVRLGARDLLRFEEQHRSATIAML
ncbi:MAG: GTPase HflX [Phycisphaerae bacterium]|nr:GTPase HflX [Phycisphaerae bacterium]